MRDALCQEYPQQQFFEQTQDRPEALRQRVRELAEE
jgi:hypothetical protein